MKINQNSSWLRVESEPKGSSELREAVDTLRGKRDAPRWDSALFDGRNLTPIEPDQWIDFLNPLFTANEFGQYFARLKVTGPVKLWYAADKITPVEVDEGGIASWDLAGEGPPPSIWAEGLASGTATLEYWLDGPASADAVPHDFVKLTVANLLVDADIDSDNSGAIAHSLSEEIAEDLYPSKLMVLNRDDDNGNGIIDYEETGPFLAPNGQLVVDDDLQPVEIELDLDGIDPAAMEEYRIRLARDDVFRYRLWEDRSKQSLIEVNAEWPITDFPATFFIEAINTTGIPTHQLTVQFVAPNGEILDEDSVNFTMVAGNLGAFLSPGLAAPAFSLPEVELDFALETTRGVGLRRNGDDDNGNGLPDFLDSSVTSENDLAKVIVEMAVPVGGIEYVLRADNELNVWSSSKSGELIGPNVNEVVLAEGGSAWVEWAEMLVGAAQASLTLLVRDTVNTVEIVLDVVEYFPYTSVIIGLSGEGGPSSGDPPTSGIRTVINQLYGEGYNVAFYDEDHELEIMAEVTRQVTEHGISQLAMFGHSHGGGSLWKILSDPSIAALDMQVPWTGYVDAVDDGSVAGDETWYPTSGNALASRPLLTEFHSNFYQTDGGLDGTRVEEADDNFDRTNEGVINHGNIDDEPFVHELIRARIGQRVQR